MSEPIYDILKVKDDLGIWHVIPALKGNRGNGIASLQFSLDGTLTITDDDGEVTTYTGITSALTAIGTKQQEIDAAELSRVLAEQTRAGAETARQNSETIRRNAETVRNADEALRRNAESARDAAELLRASAESTRQSNENSRQDAEAARAAAETSRATAETGRATAETARQAAETARASAEEDRETLYDQVSGMTADAETLAPGSSATATKQTDAQGNINFHFGIPRGTPGEVPAASIATKETSTTASRAYAAGEYFWMNGSLYKTTAPITSGGTITPGTNCALAKLGDDVGNLKSAISSISENAGVAIIGGGSASKGNLSITANGNVITLDGSDGTSSFFEIDSGIDIIAGMTSALNRTKLKANRIYRFTVEKVSGSYGSNANYVTFVIADGAASSLYDIVGDGGSVDFSFDSDKNISIINYIRYGTTVSNLVVRISLTDVTTELTANSAEDKATSALKFFEETEIKNTYESGQVNVMSNYRYFPDNLIPYRSILEDVSVYVGASNTGSFVTLEVWELSDDGTTLTRLSTETISNPTANANLQFSLNTFNEKRRMISFCKSGCYIFASNEQVAGNGLYYTSDNTSVSIAVSSMTSRSVQKISYSMKYVAADQTEYFRPFGERITSTNYASALPNLNDAPANVIFDIFQCLHNISNIPEDIDSSLTSATFFSFKGDSISSKNWIVQFLVPNGSQTKVYVRNHMDSAWKAWKELGSAAQNANLLSLDYYNATTINKLEIGSIQNKNVLTFGDSITAGDTDTSWTYHFAEMTGSTIVNKAVAGASFGESLAESSAKYISTQINGVSASEWGNADIVVVSAGTNDGLINTPHDELKEKVQAAITAIKAATNKPIVFITPIRRNTPDYSENLKLPLIAGIISNVALMNQCNVICGYNFPIPSQTIDQITNVTRDGLHPDAIGANIYARSIVNALM